MQGWVLNYKRMWGGLEFSVNEGAAETVDHKVQVRQSTVKKGCDPLHSFLEYRALLQNHGHQCLGLPPQALITVVSAEAFTGQ